MRISRIRLINFANFSDVDVETGERVLLLLVKTRLARAILFAACN